MTRTETETGLLFRRTPLASGAAVVTVGIVLTVLRMLGHTPLPDAPPGDARARVASVKSGMSATQDGVHVAIPQGWTFARYAHSPQVVERLNVPGLGVVPVGPNRKVVFAALRKPGECVVILERDAIEHMNVDEDAASLKRAVAQNVYERNVFNWVTSSREDRFKQLVNAADEMLNRPAAARRMIGFTPVADSATPLGDQRARGIGFTADLNGRESDALVYVIAHKGRWQYTLIAAIGEPPRLCSAEITWIQEHLSLE